MSGPSVAAEAIPQGTIIAGRFRIDETLGVGGMAEVYRAQDMANRRPVALKLLRPEIATNEEAVERLRREGEVLQSLDHPAIVRLETFGKLEDGRLFVAMEMLNGETLGERMHRDGPMAATELVPLVTGAVAGLAAAHARGVVHRDLKPDNIFLVTRADGIQVKLLDFGISKITGSDKITQTGEVLGTPRYMAPEQLAAERDLDGRTDVYAMGVIMYEALTGHPPFMATTPTDLIVSILNGKVAPLRSYRPDLAGPVEAVVARAMAKAREARFNTATELAEALVDAVMGQQAPGMKAQRAGMATAPLGSIGHEEVQRIVGSASVAGAKNVRPGTFSELAKPDISMPAPVVAAAGAEGVSAEGDTRLSRPSAPNPSAMQAAPVAPPAVQAPISSGNVPLPADPSGPYPNANVSGGFAPQSSITVPMKRSRWPLIVGGVLAGAISAGIAIAALHYLGPATASEESSEEPPPSEPAGDPPEGDLPQGVAIPPTEDPAVAGGEDAGAATAAADALEEADAGSTAGPQARTEPSPADNQRAVDRIRRDRNGREPDPMEGTTVGGMLRDARAAHRRGDFRRCVQLVDDAIRQGAPASALRIRGDCMLGLGDRDEALKSYERFCRLSPDHPSIGEVRAMVESMGGRC